MPVPVAVIGCGYWGRNLVRNFAELGALAAICDPDQAPASQLSARYGGPGVGLEPMLRDPAIAGVAIAAPAAQHAALATAALEAGKHVFVEKPLALTVPEAEGLCTLAEQRGRVLMVGHLLQYHPAFIALRELVRDGAMAAFDDAQPWSEKLVLYPHRIEWRETMPVPRRAEANPVPLSEGEPLNLECRHFLDCIASDARPRTDGAEGLRVLRVLARASQSLKPAPTAKADDPAPAYPGVKIHSSAFIDEPCEIGAGTRIWPFVHILPHTRIGRDCSLGQNVMAGPDVTIGDGCKIQNNVSLYKGVTLEDGVFCGPSCVFTNVNNPRAEIERKDEFRPTLVKRGATIGANATIVCGHTIGEYAFIAAGGVVTGDVPPYGLMAGVPARRIGWVSAGGERVGADLVCPRSGRHYREAGPERIEEIV